MRKYSGEKVVARAVLIIISLMKTAVKNSARNSYWDIKLFLHGSDEECSKKNLAGNCSKGYFDKGGLDDYTVDENCSKKN